MGRIFSILVLCGFLFGCTTMTHSQVMTIQPSEKPVVVVATSRAQCYDLLAIMWCKLGTKMKSSDGQQVGGVGWEN